MIEKYVVDIPAVFISAFICFSLAALWFSPALFGNRWLKEIGRSKEEVGDLINLRSLALVFLFLLLFCSGVNIIVEKFHAIEMSKGIEVGLIIWSLIVTAHAAVYFSFERRSLVLLGIYSSYYLTASVISAALHAMWR